MTPLRTARDRARSEVQSEILATARHHLATVGAPALSLRAVARDLGLVSSAVYRYFENRDALLTALIVNAYNSLGDATEAAVLASAGNAPLTRWVETADAIRRWAIARPQEYALLYGTPVPGYQAPTDTVTPGIRVSVALIGIVADAAADGGLDPTPGRATPRARTRGLPAAVEREMRTLATTIGTDLEATTLLAALLAWTQLFGHLSFELFGQTRGVIEDHATFFRAASTEMAARIGLSATTGRYQPRGSLHTG
jgi:AcrR family transcriptional regulator